MIVHANVPGGKPGPRGAVPNPGTQQQELGNITFPAPYNVFEFVVTCGACHSGTIDQQVGHFGNWAGTNMASSARDPIFRANAMIVEQTVASITGEEGTANMCFRCHSPNGWLSGRFDPNFAGASDGSTMIHSILASTDDEGISCETCHRAIGNVTMQAEGVSPTDPAWNMMAGISDWPHTGNTYVSHGNGPLPGDPLGDGTLQFSDGMTYGGKYAGSVEIYKSDLPIDGTPYTGQTYGVYPTGYNGPKPKFANNSNQSFPAGQPQFNSAGQEIVYNADGSVPIAFEVPIAPPVTGLQGQAISLEHPTTKSDFIQSPEFCGSCHDLTVPVLNHGMPEQRTYTEWKYSSFGDFSANGGLTTGKTCQDCHQPTLKQEYSDDAAVSLNADPTLVGWFPYGKDRNPNGGTTVHKLAGANRDLPQMMKILYPEVDLEVIGAPTNNDPRIFPGMQSSRDLTWDRTTRNTEISMTDGIDIEIISGPTYDTTTGKWDVNVKVTNTSGHRIPSGYPDGRRFWISLDVRDTAGASVYQSGVYDDANAELKTDASRPFNRALSNQIDSADNAVMVYEKVTATCDYSDPANPFCQTSPSLLNGTIVFDNRIPPTGYDKAMYEQAGTKFWNYDPANFVPFVDSDRYPDGQGYDLVTYSFDAPGITDAAQLNVNASIQWQTHTRPFMEHLKDSDISTLRPEGPPSIYSLNYPLDPTYLSDQVITYYNANNGSAADVSEFWQIKDMDGNSLRDNWGGIAYSAWMLSGKGQPFVAAADSTASASAPTAPANWGAKYEPTAGGVTAATVTGNPFALQVSWEPAAGTERYIVWIRYGKDTSASELGETASWDKLAVVFPQNGNTGLQTFLSEGLNNAKTYQYRVEALNGAGSIFSGYVMQQTTTDLPVAPDALRAVKAIPNNVTLSWYDLADNETGFIIERQDVPPLADFVEIGRVDSVTTGPTGFGANIWTDTSAVAGATYNYQVRAYNAIGISQPSLPVQAKVLSPPGGTISVQASVLNQTTAPQVQLSWSGATGTIIGYKIYRSNVSGSLGTHISTAAGGPTGSFLDRTPTAGTTYYYTVVAYNVAGDGAPTTVTVYVPPVGLVPPAAPTGLAVTPNVPVVVLTWAAPAGTVDGYTIQRSTSRTNWASPLSVTINGPTTTYVDTTVTAGRTYYYRVIAFNAAGSSQPSSPVLQVRAPAFPAPGNLNGNARTNPSRIELSWSYSNTINVTGFVIERRIGNNGAWSQIANVPGSSRSYSDLSVIVGTRYRYRVTAYYTTPANETFSSGSAQTNLITVR